MKSSDYFAKRAELRMKKAHDRASVSMSKVNKAFDNSLSRLKEEINELTADFAGMAPDQVRDFLNEPIDY